MTNVTFLDPRLARLRLRAPTELDGEEILGCVRVVTWGRKNSFVNALFRTASGRRLWATTEVGARMGARTWTFLEHRHRRRRRRP